MGRAPIIPGDYITRTGDPAKVVVVRSSGVFPVCGRIGQQDIEWTATGAFLATDEEHPHDLLRLVGPYEGVD